MNHESILLVVHARSLKTTTELVLRLIQDTSVIFIDLTKPYDLITEDLKNEGINTDNIFFVDCVSKLIKGNLQDRKNVLFVEKPGDLSGIGIAVSKFTNSIRGEKWIVLNSLKLLTLYSKEENVFMFLRSLLENASRHYTKVIVVTTESKDMSLINKVMRFFDKSDVCLAKER